MSSGATGATAETLHVLVAGCSPERQRTICHLLGRRGYRVLAVDNAAYAAAALAAGTFDLVLVDVQAPVTSGSDTAQLIRARDRTGSGRTPILALSDDHARCLIAGVDDYVTKPLKAAELFAAIERVTAVPYPAQEAAAADCSIDLDALHAEVGDAEVVADLCRLFTQDAPELLDELDAALAAGDMDRMYRGALRLKASADIFHAPQLIARLGDLEDAARAGDCLRARAECQTSRHMLAAICAMLDVAHTTMAA